MSAKLEEAIQAAREMGIEIPEKPKAEEPTISEDELKTLPRTFHPRLEVNLEDSNFITKYMAYAKTTSDAYEEYHFASGLMLVSVAADRQIVISMRHGDIYPNIWAFGLGDSTVSRKTTAHKLCKLILKNKYPRKSLPSSFSPEALMDAISATPRCYYLKDEAGSLLASLCKDYMAETRDFLAEIFECDDYYRKLKKSECDIRDPYISQYLMTTPDNLKEYTSPLDLTSGWLIRYLWFYPNYPKDWKPFAEKDAGDFERYTTIYGEYNLIIEKLANPRRLSMTPESMQFFQGWQQAIEEKAMEEADNITKALAGRLMTYAVKMAALFTIGRADFDENSKIELPHIQEAARLVVEYFLPIGKIIVDEVARAESKNIQDKIIGTIKRNNGLIKQRDLLRVLHMKVKEVDEAIEALMLSEEIERQIVKGKKVNTVYYRLRECHSVIVSHDEVYKGNTKGSLYTPVIDTVTLGQMGQDKSAVDGVGEPEPSSPSGLGPHPRAGEQPTKLKAIYISSGPALEYADYSLNLHNGCSHDCQYCYAKAKFIGTCETRVKKSSLENIEADLEGWQGERRPVHLTFIGDPYDMGRQDNGDVRAVLELFKKYNHPFQVLTKGGTKAVQDFDLYGEGCRFGCTLTFNNDKDSSEWEPGAALPRDRMEALRQAHERSISTWASLEPVIDPAQTLALIEATHEYVDHYGAGKWNHDARAGKIDWPKFRADAEAILRKYGKSYQIKEDLKKAAPATKTVRFQTAYRTDWPKAGEPGIFDVREFQEGEIVEVPKERAESWIRRGVAVAVEAGA